MNAVYITIALLALAIVAVFFLYKPTVPKKSKFTQNDNISFKMVDAITTADPRTSSSIIKVFNHLGDPTFSFSQSGGVPSDFLPINIEQGGYMEVVYTNGTQTFNYASLSNYNGKVVKIYIGWDNNLVINPI